MIDSNSQSMESLNYAPIAFFCFNRFDKVQQSISSLAKNNLAKSSMLNVFCDGPITEGDSQEIKKIYNFFNNLSNTNTFGSINLKFLPENIGLKKSIISGINQIFEKHQKIIVIEDDLILHTQFLEQMNTLLSMHEEDSKIWHIGGYNYPLLKKKSTQFYTWHIMHCWGWATWKDRWDKAEFDPFIVSNQFSLLQKFKFNLFGIENFYIQIQDNLKLKKSTWAIFWFATIFLNKGQCISPYTSLVKNIGLDSSGENCGESQAVYSSAVDDNIFYPSSPIVRRNKNKLFILAFIRWKLKIVSKKCLNYLGINIS
jgi:hypothetical protein